MGEYDPEVHHRRSIRLPSYDYSQSGLYFVTICVKHHACVLGDIDSDAVELSAVGRIVANELRRAGERFPNVSIDAVVIMPNHLHAIIAIVETISDDGKTPTLGDVVRAFKAASTRVVRRDCAQDFAWQRNYFERVIRDEPELRATYEYIETNPARWVTDDLFIPSRTQ